MCLFKKSPRHVAFRSLPAPKHDVFRPHLQRAAALPGTCYSPSSSSHQPPTEPRTPHEPRLPAAEMLPEQMYRDAHIIHVQTHSTNTHAHAKAHHICPLCEPAAVCRAANSVSSFKSPPKALMCRFFLFLQSVEFQHQHLSIILMSCLPWKPEAEVSIKPPQTIREQMANATNLQLKKGECLQCLWRGLVLA